jgi:hypothetical protein
MLHHLLQLAKESKNRVSSQIVDKRRGKKNIKMGKEIGHSPLLHCMQANEKLQHFFKLQLLKQNN